MKNINYEKMKTCNIEDALDNWREMMCTKMQKSLHHCETPDGIMIMGDVCREECRYSHWPLKKHKIGQIKY